MVHRPLGPPLPLLTPSGAVNREHPSFCHRAVALWGDILNNRVYRCLRDELGVAYAASFSDLSNEVFAEDMGRISISPNAESAPLALAAAVRVLLRTLSGAAPITAEELREVATPFLSELGSSVRTNSRWLNVATRLGCLGSRRTPRSVREVLLPDPLWARFTPEDLDAALASDWKRHQDGVLPIHVVLGVASKAAGPLTWTPRGIVGAPDASGGKPAEPPSPGRTAPPKVESSGKTWRELLRVATIEYAALEGGAPT